METTVEYGDAVYRHPVDRGLAFEPMSLPAMLAHAAARSPRAPLIDFFGRKFDYAAVLATSRRVATGLAALGIARGDRVGLYLPNVPHYVAAYYGVLHLGAIVVNLSPLTPIETLRDQIQATGVRLLVTLTEPLLCDAAIGLLDTTGLERVVTGTIAEALPWAGGLLYRATHRNRSEAGGGDDRVTSFRALIANEGDVPLAAIDPERDLALLQYSGGTTGPPRAAALTHQALSANARQIVAVDPRTVAADVPERILGILPLFHIFANACVMNRTIAEGGEMVLLPRFDSGETIAAIARARPTTICAMPFMYQAMVDHPRFRRIRRSSLTTAVSGAAPMSAALKERFERGTGAIVLEGYGLTEGGMIAANPFAGPQKLGTIGQVLPSTRIALVDRDHPDRDSAPGDAGEIVVQGPQIMRGYWSETDANADVFVEREGARWLRTGDVGTIDADGYVRIVDRLVEMIMVGGRRVFPSQIEAMLQRHPVVRDALVIGVATGSSGHAPKAFVTLAEGSEMSGEALRDWLNSRIGRHEQVIAIEVRDRLPRSLTGKPSRQDLLAEERRRAGASLPPAA